MVFANRLRRRFGEYFALCCQGKRGFPVHFCSGDVGNFGFAMALSGLFDYVSMLWMLACDAQNGGGRQGPIGLGIDIS